MKRIVWGFLLLGLLSLPPALWGDQTAYLGIFAETSVFKMAGMPEFSPPPGAGQEGRNDSGMPDLPEGMPGMGKMPGMGRNSEAGMPPMPGQAQRSLKVRLWAPGEAPQNASAELAVPSGLQLGSTLKLQLDRPEKSSESAAGGNISSSKFKIYRYWGSSPVVKEGQPQVISWDGLTPEQKAMVERSNRQLTKDAERPGYSQAYWPGSRSGQSRIGSQAEPAGAYQLNTNYTGNVAFTVPADIKFLPAVELTSPALSSAPDLTKSIELSWKEIPGVLGYNVTVMGVKGRDTIVIWSGAENLSGRDIGSDFLGMEEVSRLVAAKSLVAPDWCRSTVPEGIFRDCDTVQLIINGFGTAFSASGQPTPRFQTRTTLMAILGGKMMEEHPERP